MSLHHISRFRALVNGLLARLRQLGHDDPAMPRMRAAHDQASAFEIDEDGLHGLRRHERRASQLGIRDSRVAGDGEQHGVLWRGDAEPREFGIQALPQTMLRDLQVVANPVD